MKKNKPKKEKWTSDPQEIERRMVAAGLLKGTLIWGPKNITK